MIEVPLVKYGKLYLVEAMLVLILLVVCTYLIPLDLIKYPDPTHKRLAFLVAGISGLIVYALVQWVEIILEGTKTQSVTSVAVKSGLGSFLYLEVLDASFSFDGVIGAFALTNNIYIIAIGLGIGAMFVRSMTVMLVIKGTINQYKYLEHGAFWAIIALGICMFLNLFVSIPEVVTGVLGALLIGIALFSSIKAKRIPN